jgi:flavin-dependent dehydrogenase
MRKFMISAALLGVAVAATPAAAQYNQGRYGDRYEDRYEDRHGYDHRGGQQIERQLDRIVERIDRAYQRRLISANEARRLRGQANDIARLYDRYRRNGISGWEHQDLQRRIQSLRSRLQWERQEGRYDRRY